MQNVFRQEYQVIIADGLAAQKKPGAASEGMPDISAAFKCDEPRHGKSLPDSVECSSDPPSQLQIWILFDLLGERSQPSEPQGHPVVAEFQFNHWVAGSRGNAPQPNSDKMTRSAHLATRQKRHVNYSPAQSLCAETSCSDHVWPLSCLLQRGNDTDQRAGKRRKTTAPLRLMSPLNFQAEF
jgi:hypothetical protein